VKLALLKKKLTKPSEEIKGQLSLTGKKLNSNQAHYRGQLFLAFSFVC